MREDIKSLSLRVDATIRLCKNVLEFGEKIKELSPDEIGMDAYAEKLTQYTENRGRATRTAIQELNVINGSYETIENDSTASAADKAFLAEKMHSVRDLSPFFVKQNIGIRKSIEIHLKSLREESVEFRHNVGVIKNYLKAPDGRTFYG